MSAAKLELRAQLAVDCIKPSQRFIPIGRNIDGRNPPNESVLDDPKRAEPRENFNDCLRRNCGSRHRSYFADGFTVRELR
jgi:hypothetical protein